MTDKQRKWVYFGVGVPLSVLMMNGIVYLSGLLIPKYWDIAIGFPVAIYCMVTAIRGWANFILKSPYE